MACQFNGGCGERRRTNRFAVSPVIAKLQEAARELPGGALLVLLRKGDQVIEIHPSDDSDDLPSFAGLTRSAFSTRCIASSADSLSRLASPGKAPHYPGGLPRVC